MTTDAPDLGHRAWHEKDGFLHGYINGTYYRMVCTPQEREEIREYEQQEREAVREYEQREQDTPLDDDDIWYALDAQHYVDPWHADFGEFESDSPFQEDLDFEARRRNIAFNMVLDPQTTTWYRIGKEYNVLMGYRRQEEKRKVLRQRLLDLGLDPKKEQQLATRCIRTSALALGLNPYTATWQDIESTHLLLHRIALPESLDWRVTTQCSDLCMEFEQFVHKAVEIYLESLEHEQYLPHQEEDVVGDQTTITTLH